MIQKLDRSILADYSVAYAIQEQVAQAINACEPLSSAGYVAIPENARDIDFQIQNNLKKQGMAVIVMTPKLEYRGQDQDGNVYFDCPELIIQATEYVNINRAGNKEKWASCADIATFLQSWLGSLAEPVITFGELCPNGVEMGEDNGLLVATSKFKCICGQRKPDSEWFAERKKFGLKIDNLLPDVVDGVFSYPETPKSDFVVPGLSNVAAYELQSKFMRNKNVRSINLSDVVSIADYGAQNLLRNSAVEELDLTNLSSVGPYGLHYVATNATSLEKVKIGSNLTSIGNYGMCYAFYGCSALTGDIDFSKVQTLGSGYSLQHFLEGCKNFRGEIRFESLTTSPLPNQFAAGAFRNGCQISSIYIDLDNVPDTGNGAPFDNMCDQTTTNLRKLTIKNIRRAGEIAFRQIAYRTTGLKELEVTFSEKNKDSTAKSYNNAFNGFVDNDQPTIRNMTRILLDYRNSNFAYTSTINTNCCGNPLIGMNTTNIIPEIYFPEEWYCHGSATSAYHGLIYPAYFTSQYSAKNTPNIVIQGIKKIDHQWQTVLSPFAYMFATGNVQAVMNIVNFTVQDLEEVIMNNGLSGTEKQYFGIINHTFDNRTTIKNISFPNLRTLEGRIFHRANEFHANVRNLVVDLPKLETYIGDDYCIYSGSGYVDRINLHSLQSIDNPIINITSNVGNNTQIYLNNDFLNINSNIISNTTNKPITFYFSENNRAYIESHELYPTKFGGGSNCTIDFI